MAISSRQLTFQLSGGPPYGIRLQGGDNNAPFVISKIRPASKAEAIGLQEGDVIVAVNGVACRGLSHSTVTNLMDSVDTTLHLLTLRGYTAYSDVAAVENLLGSQLTKLTTTEAAAIEQNRPEMTTPHGGSVSGSFAESKPFVLQPITGKQRPFQQSATDSATYDSSVTSISSNPNYQVAVATNGYGDQHQQLSLRTSGADGVTDPDNFYSREEQSFNDGGVSRRTVEETERKSYGGGTTMTTVTRREYSTVTASGGGSGSGRNSEFSNDGSLEFARQFLQQSDSNHQGSVATAGDRHKDWYGEQVENGTYKTRTVDNLRANPGASSRINEVRQTYQVDSSSDKWNSPTEQQRMYGQDTTGSLRRRQEQYQAQPLMQEAPEMRVYQTVGADGGHSIVLPDFTISIEAGPKTAGGSGGRIPPPVVTVTPADGHGSDRRPVTLIGPTTSWRLNDQSDVPDDNTGHVTASGSTSSTQDVYVFSNARHGPSSTIGSEKGRLGPAHRTETLQQQQHPQQQQQQRTKYDGGNYAISQQEISHGYNNEAPNAGSIAAGTEWYGPVHAKYSSSLTSDGDHQSSRTGVVDIPVRIEPTTLNNRVFDGASGFHYSQQQQQQQRQHQQQDQQQYEWLTMPFEQEQGLNRTVDHVTVTVGDRPHFVHAAGAPNARKESYEMTMQQTGPVTSSVYHAAGNHFGDNMGSFQQVHHQQRPPMSSQLGQTMSQPRSVPVETDSNFRYQNPYPSMTEDHQYRPAPPQFREFDSGPAPVYRSTEDQYNRFPSTSSDAPRPLGPALHQRQQPVGPATDTPRFNSTEYRPSTTMKVGNRLPLNPHFQREMFDQPGEESAVPESQPYTGPPPLSFAATAYGAPVQLHPQNSMFNQRQQIDSWPASSFNGEPAGWPTGNVWSPPSHQWQVAAERGEPDYNSAPSDPTNDNIYGYAGAHSYYSASAAGHDNYDQYNSSQVRHQTMAPSDGYRMSPEQAMVVVPPPPPPAAPPAPPPPPPNPYKVYGITTGSNEPERRSLENKVNLANSVAHSVTSPANINSRGQKMFLKRQQNAHKWTKSGPDPVPETFTKQQQQQQQSSAHTNWSGSLQHSSSGGGGAVHAPDGYGWGSTGTVDEFRPTTGSGGFSLLKRSGSVDRIMSSTLPGSSGGASSGWPSTDAEQYRSGRPQAPPSQTSAAARAHQMVQRDGGQQPQHPSAAYRPVKLQFQNSVPPTPGPRQPLAVGGFRAGHPPPPPPRHAVGGIRSNQVAFSDL